MLTSESKSKTASKSPNVENQKKAVRLKIEASNVEESIQKRLLRGMKESMGILGPEASALEAATEMGEDFITELKLNHKVDLTAFLKLNARPDHIENIDEEFVDAKNDSEEDEDEANFFDTHEDTESLKREENKVKEQQLKELNAVKKKIQTIGSKRSALRLNLVSGFS